MSARTCRFGPLDIAYDERVLTPREWTLAESEWAAELSDDLPPGPILELCAGAGQIGLAAAALTGRSVVLVERDPVAAEYCRANAAAACLADRVEVRCEPLESAVHPHERFPLVLADPPYLPTAQITRFPEDPRTAIDGGDDGLDVVRACLEAAARALLPRSLLLLQVAGPSQAEEVAALASDRFEMIDVRVTDPERALVGLRLVWFSR